MALALTAITGTAQTGLTSPTYTPTADNAPDVNGKQYYISAVGGTQTGVVTHSIGSPFTMTFWRPRLLKMMGRLTNTGAGIVNNPKNTYKLVTRKGVLCYTYAPKETMIVTTTIEVPAGADSADEVNVRAALSAHFGALSQVSSDFGLAVITGTL